MRELRSFRQTAVWTTSYDGTTEPEICSEMIRRICCPGISMISTRFDEFKLQYPRPSAKKSIKNHRPSQYVLDPPVRILAICDKIIENVLCYFSFLTFTHCLGMSYYVNFLGGLGSNEFHIKGRFGIHGS